MQAGYRWSLDEYILRCEQRTTLREVIVEGELDRDFIADAFRRWNVDGASILDADYIDVPLEQVEAAGFSTGTKGTLLTVAAALDASGKAVNIAKRIAIVVDRDYDEHVDLAACVLVTDGYSVENYALSIDGLNRFAMATLGRSHLPGGREGLVPKRRIACSGDEIYSRIIGALATVTGLRMALRKLDPPVGLFESWLDYFRISSAGEIEARSTALLENVLSQAGQIAQLEEATKAVEVGTKEAVADPVRFIRGKDFVALLAKLLRSSWGRSRGGAVMGKDAGRLARLLLFSVDSSAVDATSLMTGLRQRFAS